MNTDLEFGEFFAKFQDTFGSSDIYVNCSSILEREKSVREADMTSSRVTSRSKYIQLTWLEKKATHKVFLGHKWCLFAHCRYFFHRLTQDAPHMADVVLPQWLIKSNGRCHVKYN